jgi:hypothetical protein
LLVITDTVSFSVANLDSVTNTDEQCLVGVVDSDEQRHALHVTVGLANDVTKHDTHADADTDAVDDGDADSDANGHHDPHADGDSDRHGDLDGLPQQHAHADLHAEQHADADPHGQPHSLPHANTQRHADPDAGRLALADARLLQA